MHSDVGENIYEVEKGLEEDDDFSPVRKVDLLVVNFGEEQGVKTYIVPPPLIFGPGTGFFTLGVGQVHMMTQLALKNKQAVMLGSGRGVSFIQHSIQYTANTFLNQMWSRIHILDLSNLFYLLVHAILDEKPDLPNGKTGYYFAENGIQGWDMIAEKIGQISKELGAFETDGIKKIELKEAADEFYGGDLRHAEGVLGSK
jgi:hypothetical protein